MKSESSMEASGEATRRMTPEERRRYARDGYLVREAVFGPEELRELRAVVEEAVADVKARAARPDGGPEIRLADGHRVQLSSREVVWSVAPSSPGSLSAARPRALQRRRWIAGICGPTTSSATSRSGGASTRWRPSAYA